MRRPGGDRTATPWHTLHKGALHYPCVMQGSGNLVELLNFAPKRGYSAGDYRGAIGDLPSEGTHRRFARAMAAIPFEKLGVQDMWVVVLTYPGIPEDGRKVAREKKAFFRRLDRVLGEHCWSMIWVKEFQRRGSVHFHGVLHVPFGAPPGLEVDYIVRKAWLEVIQQEHNLAAWLHGVECSRAVSMQAIKRYESKHMGKHGRECAKAYQKVQPSWFKGGGRWWGIIGQTLIRSYETFRLRTVAEFIAVKRLLRSYVNSITHGHYAPKSYGAMYGSTIIAHGPDYEFLREAIRWVTMQRPTVAVCAT